MTPRLKTYRDFILEGRLPLPGILTDKLRDTDLEVAKRCMASLWLSYVKNKQRASSTYWADQFSSQKAFRKFIIVMSQKKWIVSSISDKRNWAEFWLDETKLLTFVSREELMEVRIKFKVNKYSLDDGHSNNSTKTKLGNDYVDTGLKREGFAKAGKSKFQYDKVMIERYKPIIEKNLTKAMDKLDIKYEAFEDKVDYSSICNTVLDSYLVDEDKWFTTGANINDSRGRAISQGLKKIFNPISNKDARSLLVLDNPRTLNKEGLNAVYLFIAELTGCKADTFTGKMNEGMFAYLRKQIPLSSEEECWPVYTDEMSVEDIAKEDERAEEARKEFHERIWLERIYENLDKIHAGTTDKWYIPIELDGTASMIQIQGVLLNHKPFLDKTNVVGDCLKDMWHFAGVPRLNFKKAMTPLLYGSSQSVVKLWRSAKLDYTMEQVRAVNKELKTGDLAVANLFKEFIINNAKPQEEMTVKIWNEEFKIKCNRYTTTGEGFKQYKLYDSETKSPKIVTQSLLKSQPDLEQFKRYFVTLLIHNLDSQVADAVCEAIDWIIPIHDAFIIHPNDAVICRKVYCDKLDDMYIHRKSIIKGYFKSIGIDAKSAIEWTEVIKRIKPCEDFKAQPSALK